MRTLAQKGSVFTTAMVEWRRDEIGQVPVSLVDREGCRPLSLHRTAAEAQQEGDQGKGMLLQARKRFLTNTIRNM
jgi:hypothetical protein